MTLRINISISFSQAYAALRGAMTGYVINLTQAYLALRRIFFDLALYAQKTLARTARSVCQGAFNVYIQGVVVKPDYQGQGLGRDMLSQLINQIKPRLSAQRGAGLITAGTQDGLYKQSSFSARPSKGFNAGMNAKLENITS